MKTIQKHIANGSKATKVIAVFLALSFLTLACHNSDQTSRLEVRLTDAPGDYQQVNIDIQQVEVHSESGNQTGGWKSLEVHKGIYDLLELTNGLDTLLATAELPAGRVSQIRLILGNNNSVKIAGVVSPLSTPSAQQSGLKLNVQTELKEGVTYTILLDFDAARSVVEKGNRTFSLKPVIHAVSEPTSGAIRGVVTPLASAPAVFVILGSDTVATAYTDDSGKFLVRGVPAGIYKVSFNPKVGYTNSQKENVNVTVGQITDLGTVTIF